MSSIAIMIILQFIISISIPAATAAANTFTGNYNQYHSSSSSASSYYNSRGGGGGAGDGEVSMGTTILAVRYNGGVVVGADTRTSTGGYVSNRFATKISFVLDDTFDLFVLPPFHSNVQLESSLYDQEQQYVDGDNEDDTLIIDDEGLPRKTRWRKPALSTCCICRSGSAADSQNLVDKVRHQLLSRRILHSTPSSVSHVASLLRNYLTSSGNNGNPLHTSLICAGFDHEMDRGVIYSVDLGGTLVEQEGWTCSGSGSSYILGFMDANFPKYDDVHQRRQEEEEYYVDHDHDGEEAYLWNEEQAVAFVGKAIELAMARDGSSGGFVRMFVINKYGKKGILRMPRMTSGSGSTHSSHSSRDSMTSHNDNTGSTDNLNIHHDNDNDNSGSRTWETEWTETIRKSSAKFLSNSGDDE